MGYLGRQVHGHIDTMSLYFLQNKESRVKINITRLVSSRYKQGNAE